MLFFLGMKGWIALDIDGTITQDKYSIPSEVINFLHDASKSGWKIAFATGRAFVFARPAVEKIPFPFFLLPQNGSVALKMPEKQIVFKRYMSSSLLSVLKENCEGFLVYSGVENEDLCYYNFEKFSKQDLLYLEEIQKREKEKFVNLTEAIPDFDFPLVKCFGKLSAMKKIGSKLLKTGFFEVSLIRDPFSSYYILLITDKHASKGLSLQELFSKEGRGEMVVAAGDDENDMSLLAAADVKIAMPHAPEIVRKIADFIAPPVSEMGIIHALKIVIGKCA